MVTSSTNISPNQLKYYVFATISFLVAVSFHSRVYHRFDIFETNMKEAARIKMTMEWDELKALNNYMQSVRLHRRGIHDTIEAYEYATAAIFLNETVQKEEKEVKHLRDEANQLEQQAKFDERMSTIDGMSSFQNNRASVGSRVAGFNLAKQAEEENERSEILFNRTSIDEALGKEKLVEAQKALLKAEMAQNSNGLDKGICYWASGICSTVRSKNTGTNSSYPAQPSNDVIKANRDIQNALKMIHKAEEEKSLAIELHRNASLHANMSTALLADTMAFRNESNNGLNLADEYREKAQEEEVEAKKDEQLAEKEESVIALKEAEIQDDNERSKYMFRKVGADRYQEAHAIQRMNKDLEYVELRRSEWEQKMEEAKLHVAKAGWEALMASVSGLCLLVLVVTQIIATFRYQQPLRWILREPPFFSQDLWYLICHVSIFVLAMGYVGELLMNFHNQSNMSRVGIVIIFVMIAASLQILFLHLLQALNELAPTTQMDSSTIQMLLKKLVVQKGTVLALVSAIELLLCWCWIGTTVFTQVHKMNNDLVWFLVLCETAGYMFVLKASEESNAYASPNYSNVPGVSSQLPSSVATNDERDSLLGPTVSGRSLGDVRGATSPNASYGSPPSMHSVPFGGSNDLSTSSMGFSWSRDLVKVRLLFEFWLASLGLWIVRRDLELIRKLSPLSAGLVWGMVPLWILNICLFLVVATLIVSLANVKQRHL